MPRQITVQLTYDVVDEDRVRSSLVMPLSGDDGSVGVFDSSDIERALPMAFLKLTAMDIRPHATAAGIEITNATIVDMR